MSETYKGQCHCGALSADIKLSVPSTDIELRSCQCDFCKRHNGLTFTDPLGEFVLYYQAGTLKRYRMGLGITEFLLCDRCGVYVAAVMNTKSGLKATVNSAGLGLDVFSDRQPKPVNYDGETADIRRRRRIEGWTPAKLIETDTSASSLQDCA
ncbi:MAG: aldehyde-activating protein [Pseudomonadota bacterium]